MSLRGVVPHCTPREKQPELLKAEGKRWRVNRELVRNEKEVDRQTEAQIGKNGERKKDEGLRHNWERA